MSMTQDSAETVALQALTWIAASDDLLPVFLGSTGTAADELRERMKEADFLASVLDFMLMDDAWIIGFCDGAGLSYDSPKQARAALPGGEQISWT